MERDENRRGAYLKDGKKTCSGCLKEKTADCFAKSSRMQDGLAYQCRDCYWDDYLRKRYGIGAADYWEMLQQQQGKCGICKKSREECGVKNDQKWIVKMNDESGNLHLVCRRCVRNTGKYVRKGTLAENGIKKCATCLKDKPVDEFFKRTSLTDGYMECCKVCDRNRRLKYLYGISADKYWEMVAKQDDRCDCCRLTKKEAKHPNDKYWYVDHCHKTGNVRGLVCHNCNQLIGWAEAVKDKVSVFDYLKRYSDESNTTSTNSLSA